MCRAADPESKGKIENAVRYVKHGFLENGFYPLADETLNNCAIARFERTANAKIHDTTRKVPTEVFNGERDYMSEFDTVSLFYVAKKLSILALS